MGYREMPVQIRDGRLLGRSWTGAVDLSSRARYTGRYMNISIYTYQKQTFAYPVFILAQSIA
jgi:hypothetical protein